jgi:predicted nuclease of predicted toxin-antitoxin system
LRFLADECVHRSIVESAELDPSADDATVLTKARSQRRILITNDKDFANLAFRDKQQVPGIVLVRLPGLHPKRMASRVAEAIKERGVEVVGKMTVIEPATIRARPLPESSK